MNSWKDAFVEANGIRLHYWRTGGEGTPMVLCHGITDNGLCWTRAARQWQATYDVIMLDARGHGESDRPETGYTTQDHANDTIGLIEALGLERVILIGHSMGGMTAALVTAQRPDLIVRAVLEDPPWRAQEETDPAGSAARMEAWKQELLAQQQQPQAVIADAGRVRSPRWDDVEFEPWALAKKQVSGNVFGYRFSGSPTWQEMAVQISVPTLLVTGDVEEGAIVSAATAAELTDANPNLRHLHLPGAGHNIRREAFDAFMAGVGDFLK